VREAVERQEVIQSLSNSVGRHLSRLNVKKLSRQRFEAEILKGIVKYKTKFHRQDNWYLSEQGLLEVTNDFKLLYDFHFGSQTRELERFIQSLGELFLLETERAEYKKLEGNAEEQFAWLAERVSPRLRSLWYLVVSYCRLLQTTDYSLEPEDAYWLGLVDEVCGSGLPNVREMVENLPKAEAVGSAS